MSAGSNKRLAIVTGAASGIGRATAIKLAEDGFAVAVFDLDGAGARAVAKEIRKRGGCSYASKVDVRSENQVLRAISKVQSSSAASLEVLVNSAGILERCPFLELRVESWRHLLDVNLTGTFICAQAAARAMVDGGSRGRIINVASVHSHSPGKGLAHYDASKGGIWMLTKSLALELSSWGITVNAVGPGLITETNLGGSLDESYLKSVIPSIPLARAGHPNEVAGAISFLSSDMAAYITGAMLVVDGGMLLSARL